MLPQVPLFSGKSCCILRERKFALKTVLFKCFSTQAVEKKLEYADCWVSTASDGIKTRADCGFNSHRMRKNNSAIALKFIFIAEHIWNLYTEL